MDIATLTSGFTRERITKRYNLFRDTHRFQRAVIFLLAALFCVHCGASTKLDSAGNDSDDVLGVNPSSSFVRQGVSSSYVETENYVATVYVGKQTYQDSESAANSSYSPQMNLFADYDN